MANEISVDASVENFSIKHKSLIVNFYAQKSKKEAKNKWKCEVKSSAHCAEQNNNIGRCLKVSIIIVQSGILRILL